MKKKEMNPSEGTSVQLVLVSVLFLFFNFSAWAASGDFSPNPKWIKAELKKMGMRKSFIDEAIKNYEEDTFETVLKLNLLGFLQPPQHMHRVDPLSIQQTNQFIKSNQESFDAAVKKFKIPASVISALLWIETRHGDDRGRFHILSVYLHLLQSQRKEVSLHLTKVALEQNKQKREFKESEIRKIMKERAKKKRAWAKEQILALADIHQKKKLNLQTLKGSFAGAFGIPQFIPSSYRDYAKAMKPKTSPDLYNVGDAVLSVAYYLLKHGWSNQSLEAKIAALMKYNNSRDYAESILEISRRAGESGEADRVRESSNL